MPSLGKRVYRVLSFGFFAKAPRPSTSLWSRLALAATLVGCSSAAEVSGEETGVVESAILGGVRDDAPTANDAIVALRIGDGSPFELCTGSLIAPNLVLTARHCLATELSDDIDCDEKGLSHNGKQAGSPTKPESVHIHLGATPDFSGPPAANGLTIFHPDSNAICNTDIALVVLDRPIANVTPLAIRLDRGVNPGERITAIGYGQSDQNKRLGTRFRKENIEVMGVGPMPRTASTGRPALGAAEFEVGRSICQGDSGGPAISQTTGAIVGVVSRGVECNLDFGHIYTKTAGFQQLFDRALSDAQAKLVPEAWPESDVAKDLAASSSAVTRSTRSGVTEPMTAPTETSSASGCSTASVSRSRTASPWATAIALALAGLLRGRAGRRRSSS